MVAPRFGKADPDIRKGSKETRDKKMQNPGEVNRYTALIGGTGNGPRVSDAKKGPTMSFKNGGRVPSATDIPAYNPGGFRNRAMEHKR